jgi:hypothetical protein
MSVRPRHFFTFFHYAFSSKVSDDKNLVVLSRLISSPNNLDKPAAVVCPLLYDKSVCVSGLTPLRKGYGNANILKRRI